MSTLQNISKIIVFFTVLTAGSLFANTEVTINLSGTLPEELNLEIEGGSISESVQLDLESNYDSATGTLAASSYDLVDLDAYGNSSNGYSITAISTNGFLLTNDDGVEIPYTLTLPEADTMPENSTTQEVSIGGDPLLNVSGNSQFSDNVLDNGKLVLNAESVSDFTFSDGEFSDTITLTISAN